MSKKLKAVLGSIDEKARLRYALPPDKGSYLRLQIVEREAALPKPVTTIVIDNRDWVLHSGVFLYDDSRHEEYVRFMVKHENEPFSIAPDKMPRLLLYKAPTVSKRLASLPPSIITARYLQLQGQGYCLRPNPQVSVPELICLLLQRGAVVYQGCVDGRLMVFL